MNRDRGPSLLLALPVALALVLLVVPPALAQSSGGQVTGVVRDASGAALPGATVSITNNAGVTRVATSGSDGSYSAADVPPGVYTVTAELRGFGRATRRDVRVAAGATASVDLALESLAREEVVTVTGTRVRGRIATDTPAPVDIFDSQAIESTGATETGKILQLLEPSFNFSTTYISDGTDIIRPATLRGLGPDQTLLLVNGKRRHQTALIHIQQTIARGSAGYDINTIPASSIDRIEVLRDGAAAQYGSDAIAGVINFILKEDTRATNITLEGGQHYAENPGLPLGASPDAETGHGRNFLGAINTGFKVGDGGFVNLTAEYRDRGETNRAGPDILRVDPPRVVQRIGDPKSQDFSAFVNAGFPVGARGGQVYAFGGYSWREGNSSGFFRSKGDGRTVPAIYPNGFLPTILTRPIEYSASVGYRAPIGSSWSWDVSANYGNGEFKFREENTVNVSYWYEPRDPNNPTGPRFEESPTSGDTGTLTYDQVAFNLDFVGSVDWGVGAGPLNVALGTEWRQEGYKITPGETVSYQYGRTNNRSIAILNQNGGTSLPGTQGFPGFDPSTAVDEDRNTFAVYADLESQLAKKFLGAAAIRYEHYSDFGDTVNGKLSARINFTDRFSLRGTFSTGFRAPGVQQKYFSLRSTNLNAAGVLTDTLTARQDSAVTRDFGIPPLKEETSLNYSAGLVIRPSGSFRVTVDYFRIDIDDRIIFSSNIQPSTPEITEILERYVPGGGQVQFFTNAIDTETQGVDIVALYDHRLGDDAVLSFEAAFNFNKTEVAARKSSSAILPAEVLFDQAQVTLVEEGQPRQHFILGGTYRKSDWRANVRVNYFGEVAGEGFTGVKQTWSGKWITDASLTVPLVKDKLSLTVGGLNIFDVFPDEWFTACPGETFLQGCSLAANDNFPFPQLGFVYGWETLPFGINGGYYYARLNLRFNH